MALHLVGDLARSGSDPGGLGLSDPARVPDFTAASQQIVGKPDSYAFGRRRAALAAWHLILPEGRGRQIRQDQQEADLRHTLQHLLH